MDDDEGYTGYRLPTLQGQREGCLIVLLYLLALGVAIGAMVLVGMRLAG